MLLCSVTQKKNSSGNRLFEFIHGRKEKNFCGSTPFCYRETNKGVLKKNE